MSNTQATLFLVSLGILATLIRSMLDQGQAQFQNRWLLPAVAIGVCGAVVTIGLGVIEKPRRADVGTYAEQKLAGREPEGTPPAAVPGRSVGIAGISDTLKVFLERLFLYL